jgi:hypothetical protein
MEDVIVTPTRHPDFFDTLFVHHKTMRDVLNGILKMYNIDHIALYHINANHEVQALSSTPALEFIMPLHFKTIKFSI